MRALHKPTSEDNSTSIRKTSFEFSHCSARSQLGVAQQQVCSYPDLLQVWEGGEGKRERVCVCVCVHSTYNMGAI